MKRILVPTDFSSTSGRALEYALCIARKAQGEIILLHVCESLRRPFHFSRSGIRSKESRLKSAHVRMLDYKQALEHPGNVGVTTEVRHGSLVPTIEKAAEELAVDLVVMATRGLSRWQTSIFGSNTAAVMSRSRVPVISVPHNYDSIEPKKILMTLNEAGEDPLTVKPAFTLARLFESKMTTAIFSDAESYASDVMRDNDAIHTIRKKLSNAYGNDPHRVIHLTGEDFSETIRKYIEQHQINLMVMVSHKTNSSILIETSMTRHMAYRCAVPLLSINGGKLDEE